MQKVMVVFGTRPEAIKMCPLVKELKTRQNLETIVCVTGQHRQMLDQVLQAFDVIPEYDLSIMKDKQTLFDVTQNILGKMKEVLEEVKPNVVLVHGDTSTTFVTALAAFYLQIPVGHVEAGLRTYDIYSPFPEEFNRQATGIVAQYHFAPTEVSKQNLLNEGKKEEQIYVTGNTAIDALKTTVREDYTHPVLEWVGDSRLIMLTAHRRENLGEPLKHMFSAIKRIVDEHEDIKVIYPIHMNPVVRETANAILGDHDRIRIIEPLEVLDFHNFLNKSYLILTDSGGIQEEAPSLGKPVLVMRDTTERPEGVAAGTLKLVGTDEEVIYTNFKELLNDESAYEKMSKASNPYGDGLASKRIANALERDHKTEDILVLTSPESKMREMFSIDKEKLNEYGLSMKTVPDYLYKYVSITSNKEEKLRGIEAGTIWLSYAWTLNDPFEGINLYIDKERLRQVDWPEKYIEAIYKNYERMQKHMLVGSFACNEEEHNMLLWSHYAEGHLGYSLKYKVINDKMIYPVEYIERKEEGTRLLSSRYSSYVQELSKRDVKRITNEDNAVLFVNYCVKHNIWEYENEFRILGSYYDKNGIEEMTELIKYLIYLDKGTPEYSKKEKRYNELRDLKGVCFSEQELGLQLEAIYVGQRCKEKEELVEIARKRGIQVYDMIPTIDTPEYKLIQKRIL